jgi:hypothetical protein
MSDTGNNLLQKEVYYSLARIVLSCFVLTFSIARIIVFLIMSHRIPDLYLFAGQTHIHHLNYGIFLLSVVGGYLLFFQTSPIQRKIAAAIYGIAMALTFDEFGMWLHLGGGYWQRASWDIIAVIASALALFAFAPAIKKFRPRHWTTMIITLLVMTIFFVLLTDSFNYMNKTVIPKLQQMESSTPI